MIVYLHGFRSSPQSTKARMIAARIAAHNAAHDAAHSAAHSAARTPAVRYECPQLPVSPRETAELLRALVRGAGAEPLALIGSSLGGYYATWLAERCDCRAALLNPAIRPYDGLQAYLGSQTVFHSDARIELRPEHLDELRALDTPRIGRPDRYLLVAATGDELIDYRTMVAKYAGCTQRVVEGSDHALSDFDAHIDAVLDFCLAADPAGRPAGAASGGAA